MIPVSVDGVVNPLLPDSRMDQGQAEQLGVKFFPAMMLVNPKSGQVKPLSYGFISQDDLAKQFLYVSSDFKPNFKERVMRKDSFSRFRHYRDVGAGRGRIFPPYRPAGKEAA